MKNLQKIIFFLINNKSTPILETVKSRSIEIKIILNESQRIEIIKNLLRIYQLEPILDPISSQLSPGNFVKFNYLCLENKINLQNDLNENLKILLNLYKKNKDMLFINLAFFIVDYYFDNLRKRKTMNNDKLYEIKNYFFSNLNKFMLYNINQNSLLNAISSKLEYE